MAAISTPRLLSPLGSGGKFRRARRSHPEYSPYLRPALGRGPSSPRDSPKHGWLSTAVRSVASTAGKLLSVLRSESSSSSSSFSSRSSSTSSSSDGNGESDEYEDVDGLCHVCSKKTDDLYTNGNLPAATPSTEKEPQSITQDRSRTKLAIEYLLTQETYTREECMKLTKIIQSRVVDGPITEVGKDAVVKGLYDQSFGNVTLPSETRLLRSQIRKSPHLFSHLENRWSIFSPKSLLLHAGSPDVYKTAITEAKKWLQEKKSEINSKSNLDQEPCTVNTDLPSYDNGRDMGSPVDLAKSYMQSRPPWTSPSLLNFTMKSHSPIQLQFSDDETQHAMSHHLPSLEAAKRSSGFVESSCIHEEVRRFRLKLEESISEHSMLKQNKTPPRLLANVSGETSLFAHERSELEVVSHKSDSAQVGNAVNGSAILPQQLEVDNADSEDTIRSSHGRDMDGNFVVTDVGNGKLADPSSLNTLSNCGEDAVAERHEFSMHGDELCAACPTLSLQDNHEDLGDAYLCQQNGGNGTKSTAPTSLPTQNIGATTGEPTVREILLSQETSCSMLSDTDRRVDNEDASISKACSEMCSVAEKLVDGAVEPVKVSCDASSLLDLKQQEACGPIQNASSNKAEAGESSSSRSSVPKEPNAKSGGKSSKKSQQQSGSRSVGLANSQEVHELQSDASKQVPSDVERNDDIEAQTQTSSRTNAPKGHANGNRRTEVGYKRRRTGK